MSLDVYLSLPEPQPAAPRQAIFIRRDGANVEITRDEWNALRPGIEPVTATINSSDADTAEIFTQNITHNLGPMAAAAGIYKLLWRPDEVGVSRAWQLIEPLSVGLALLQGDPDKFRALNPENGWGSYDGLVQFTTAYLAACRVHPDATVSVSR